MLKMQLVSAERDLQSAQSRLDRIMARLQILNSEDEMTTYEVNLKSVEALTVAAMTIYFDDSYSRENIDMECALKPGKKTQRSAPTVTFICR